MAEENSLVQNINLLKNLPKGWKVLPFSRIIKDVSGGNIKTKKGDFLENGKFKVVDQGKDLFAGFVSDEKLLVKSNSPYIVFGDHTRVIKYIDFPFAMGADGTKILKIKSDINSFEKYVYYFFQTLNIPNTGYNRHFKYLKDCQIPLPKLETQKKIAAILDEADKIRQLNKELIAKYDALTQSLFLDMFGKLDKNVIELGEVIKLIGGGTPSKDKEEYWDGNIPWASVKDLKSDSLAKTVDKVTIEGVNNSSTKIIPKGSLIVATRMAVGRATICEMDVAINQDLKAIKIIENVNVVYLQSLFKSKEKYFDSVSSGATVKGIKIEHITRLKIPIPPIELQNQFAERVQIIEKQKQQAQESLQKSEDLFNSLLQKAFKGELVKE
tara:strand:- start:4181 stop:5329 length:1149 start_codon:yes stop_codon:yes gene_type:complete